jgi:hypothetical protein
MIKATLVVLALGGALATTHLPATTGMEPSRSEILRHVAEPGEARVADHACKRRNSPGFGEVFGCHVRLVGNGDGERRVLVDLVAFDGGFARLR